MKRPAHDWMLLIGCGMLLVPVVVFMFALLSAAATLAVQTFHNDPVYTSIILYAFTGIALVLLGAELKGWYGK